MAIRFEGLEFPGTAGPVMTDPPNFAVQHTEFQGAAGEVEMGLGRRGRSISFSFILHSASFTRRSHVAGMLDSYDAGVGINGELTIDEQKFPGCTFEGFRPSGGILPDLGGTLNPKASPSATTYYIIGELRFYQLTVDAV